MINYYETVKAHPEIFNQLTYKELLFAKYNCPSEKRLLDKWTQHNFFINIVVGTATIHTPDRSWTLNSGDSIMIKKGAHIMEKNPGEILCIMSFFVPESYLRPFLRENVQLLRIEHSAIVANDLVIPLEKNEVMKAFYESMFPYFNTERKPPEEVLELKFRELLFNVIANPANCELIAYLQTLLADHDYLQQTMEANYLFNLQLEDYARLCNRSLSSFKRDFQLTYGVPPGHWLLEKKLTRAKHQLMITDKSINDISFECGFESNTHFSRAFKNLFGASPLQFRKQAIGVHQTSKE